MNIAAITCAKDKLEVYSLDRLKEEALRAGHTFQRLYYPDCSMSITRSGANIFYRDKELTGIDAVLPRIIQANFEYGMDVLRQFEAMGVPVINPIDGFRAACYKWQTAQLLANYGVDTPDTYRALAYQHMETLINDMSSEKSVLKISSGTSGVGVVIAKDKETSIAISGAFGICRDNYIVQEFIEESSGTDVRAYVVGGEVIAAMERSASNNGLKSNLSLGGVGQPITLTAQEKNAVLAAMRALQLNTGGVDVMRSARGPLVIEINASAQFGIEKVCGVNVAKRIIEYIEQTAKHGRLKKTKPAPK